MNTCYRALHSLLTAAFFLISCNSPSAPSSIREVRPDALEEKTAEVPPQTTEQVSRPFTLWFVGDPGECGSRGPYLTAALIPVGEMILGLGDFAHPRGREKDFLCFDDSWRNHVPHILTALGNHDAETENGAAYCRRFPQYCARRFYSFDREHCHFVALNSEEASARQLAWLREDLRENRKSCLVAFWHRPLFSGISSNTNVHPFWQELYASGADLVLNGHDHYWDVFEKQDPSGRRVERGIRQITNGAGGVRLRTDVSRISNSTGPVFAWGVGKLTFGERSYSWEFVQTDGVRGAGGSDSYNPKPK